MPKMEGGFPAATSLPMPKMAPADAAASPSLGAGITFDAFDAPAARGLPVQDSADDCVAMLAQTMGGAASLGRHCH